MARKTAMKKEPTVSIAVPKAEKERLRNLKPGGPSLSDGVIQGKPSAPKRLSPGVYRSSTGELVGSKGQALPGQPSLRDKAMDAARRGLSGRSGDGRDRANAGMLADAMNQAPQGGQVATRPPAPLGTPPEGGQMTQQIGMQRPPGFVQENRGGFTPQMNEQQYQQLVEWMKQQGGGGMMPPQGMPGLPQPSANNGGQYRLSPGVYGTREQAMDQYARQFEQIQPAPGMPNGLRQNGNMPPIDWTQVIPYRQNKGQ